MIDDGLVILPGAELYLFLSLLLCSIFFFALSFLSSIALFDLSLIESLQFHLPG